MSIVQTSILLIEDDDDDVLLLKKHLARIPNSHFVVTREYTYEEGLTHLLQEQYDICLLDYRLGIHNGIELVGEARKRGVTLPVVLLTGANNAEIDILALQAGADDYIDKGSLQSELLYRVIRYAIERKKAERERERLLREQIESRELEQKRNEFISIVVHELKTPLTSIKGYAQLLIRKSARSGDEQLQQLASRVDTQITKLTKLIDDFRDVTRLAGGALQFQEDFFSFDDLVSEVIEEVQLTTQKQKIEHGGETHATIWADRTRIGQVITNFLVNAIKYAPKADRILVRSSVDAEKVRLCIQDFGPGVPKSEQTKIFEAFYRNVDVIKSATPGLGLGLHVAAEIIKRQDGSIWVESEEGQGATFCFTLPLHRPSAPEPGEL